MSVKEMVENYFEALHHGDWQSYIADDIIFVVNDTKQSMAGKETYLQRAGQFFRSTTGVSIKQMLVENNNVAVLASYDVQSPKGTTGTCDVAEFLTVENGQLTASSIFFDLKSFSELMAR